MSHDLKKITNQNFFLIKIKVALENFRDFFLIIVWTRLSLFGAVWVNIKKLIFRDKMSSVFIYIYIACKIFLYLLRVAWMKWAT